jgi:hypothetical protein
VTILREQATAIVARACRVAVADKKFLEKVIQTAQKTSTTASSARSGMRSPQHPANVGTGCKIVANGFF